MTAVVIGAAALLLIPLSMLLLSRGLTRRDSLAHFAASRGYHYLPVVYGYGRRWAGPPFDPEGDGAAHDFVEGSVDGDRFLAFDLVVEPQDGGSPSRTGVYVLQLPGWLPPLAVSRERGVRVSDIAGVTRTVDLESDDFNRAFRVEATDRRYAYDVLTARAMAAMLDLGDVSFRFAGTDLLVWTPGVVRPERVDEIVPALRLIAGTIGDHVWREYGRDA